MASLLLHLGWFDLLAPLLLWVALFVAATVVGDIFLFRWARRRLRAAGRKLGVATGVMAVVQFALLPIAAGYFAVAFSLHRSVAAVVEDAGPRVVDWVMDGSAKALGAELGVHGDDPVIDVGAARARVQAKREVLDRALADRRGQPPLAQLHELLDRAWLTAVDRALDGAGDRITWRDLLGRIRDVLVHHALGQVADRFRQGARVSLYLLLGVVGGADGLTILAVWLATRRKREHEAAAAAA